MTCGILLSKHVFDLQIKIIHIYFQNSTKLFGTSKDQSRTQEEINFEPISPQNFLGGNGPDYSCLKELRSTPFGSKSAANIAHSGTISSRHKRKIANAVIGMDESESMRTLLFVNMIENLCVSDNQNKYDSRACRHLVCLFWFQKVILRTRFFRKKT